MQNKIKDKIFLLVVVVVSVLVGMGLMLAISNYKNQAEVGAAEAGFSATKARK